MINENAKRKTANDIADDEFSLKLDTILKEVYNQAIGHALSIVQSEYSEGYHINTEVFSDEVIKKLENLKR